MLWNFKNISPMLSLCFTHHCTGVNLNIKCEVHVSQHCIPSLSRIRRATSSISPDAYAWFCTTNTTCTSHCRGSSAYALLSWRISLQTLNTATSAPLSSPALGEPESFQYFSVSSPCYTLNEREVRDMNVRSQQPMYGTLQSTKHRFPG